jgi:hypothetical protein|tara:strand:+ start:10779 stop:10943 length:165 start_codon:yes stop_codon:yes gene_type:complete
MNPELNKLGLGTIGSILAVSFQGISEVMSIAASVCTIAYMGLWVYKTIVELRKR